MSRSLLAGLGLRLVAGPGRAVGLASAYLRSLGADVTVSAPGAGPSATQGGGAGRGGGGHRPGARLQAPSVVTAGADPGAGLPSGTLDLAVGMALAAGALAAARLAEGPTAPSVAVDPDAVAAHLLLPLVLAAAADLGPPATPPPPRPTADGAVCADLAVEGDDAAFGRLLRTGPGAGSPGSLDDAEVLRLWSSEELAARAQEWRLPVTPYRRRGVTCLADERHRAGTTPIERAGSSPLAPAWATAGRSPHVTATARRSRSPHVMAPPARRRLPLEGVTVADLTIMWSGPLATWLLTCLGARVVKVEPDCRLDGTRFSPGGRLFDALNAGKERAPLDLRRDGDRRAFRDLLASSDLVVDNFSPRVAPNLGITHDDLTAINPSVLSLSLPAFPPGPERHWVSYGTGVHAASGLGDAAADGFAAPIVTYPDPLGGITAAAAALALIVARDRGARPGHAEVALADAVGPLRSVPDDGALLRRPDPALPGRLARAGHATAVPAPPGGGLIVADEVLLELRDDDSTGSTLAVVSLNRPDKLNIYNLAMRDALIEALGAVRDVPGVGALLLRANGPHFSAGADLAEFGSAETPLEARRIRWDRDPWGILWDLPCPTVVALHGHTVGSGLEMALLCDLRLAAPGTRLGLPETRLGMLPAAGGTQSLTRALGPGRALPLIATARTLGAAEALELGVVQRLADDVEAEAEATARQLAALPRASASAARRALHAAGDLPLPLGLALERRLAASLAPPEPSGSGQQ